MATVHRSVYVVRSCKHFSHCRSSFRSLHLQRSNPLRLRNHHQHVTYNPHLRILRHCTRCIWIPPIWLRPLLRPLIVIVGGFIGGIILQQFKGHPPQWLLSASAESSEGVAATSVLGKYGGRLFGGSVVLTLLYLTRLRNPLYISLVGATDANLECAQKEATAPFNSLWDSRSANDSMKTRLASMEQYLGAAMSAAPKEKMEQVQSRVDAIRQKGYTNAIKIALDRAEFWSETGEIVKFEQMIDLAQKYVAEGGVLSATELDRVRKKAYGTRCSVLFAQAQTFSNTGDVSQCQRAISGIKNIQSRVNGQFVAVTKLDDVVQRAHQHHVSHMFNEARKAKHAGSRKQCKLLIEQSREYCTIHNVPFDDETATQIISST